MNSEKIDWTTTTDRISSVEDIIQKSYTPSLARDHKGWRDQALAEISNVDERQTIDEAQALLRDIPYGDVLDALQNFTPDDERLLKLVRQGRKLFLIARDAIIVTTEYHATDDFALLRFVCRELGRVADTPPQDGDETLTLQLAVSSLASTPSLAHNYVTPKAIVHTKAAQYLQTDTLRQLETDPAKVEPEQLHKWRKDYRRIGHLFTLRAANEQDEHLTELAAQGLAINRYFGDIVDDLDKRPR